VLTHGMSYARLFHARSVLAAAGLVAVLPPLTAPVQAKDCSIKAAPSGVRLSEKPGCRTALTKPEVEGDRAALKAGRRPGFIDLGNGTEVRIGGRVRLDIDHSR
jgi:hypothetical protein